MFNNKTSTNLRSKTDSIVNVFNKTATDLQSINDSAESEIARNKEEADRILKEINSLEDLKKSNDKIINKIKNFLE